MNNPTTTITCPNPKCAREHGLFWYVYKEGPRLKKQLSYRCDHAERISHNNHEGTPIPVRATAILIAPANVIVPLGLPEEYTPAAKVVVQGQAQMQLPMPTTRK